MQSVDSAADSPGVARLHGSSPHVFEYLADGEVQTDNLTGD